MCNVYRGVEFEEAGNEGKVLSRRIRKTGKFYLGTIYEIVAIEKSILLTGEKWLD